MLRAVVRRQAIASSPRQNRHDSLSRRDADVRGPRAAMQPLGPARLNLLSKSRCYSRAGFCAAANAPAIAPPFEAQNHSTECTFAVAAAPPSNAQQRRSLAWQSGADIEPSA